MSTQNIQLHTKQQYWARTAPWGTRHQLRDSDAMADRSRADATALWSGSAESNPLVTRGNLQRSAASVSAKKGDVQRGDGASGVGMVGAYLVMLEARWETGRQLRRRREEETARAKALDRAATAVAAIGVAWKAKFR